MSKDSSSSAAAQKDQMEAAPAHLGACAPPGIVVSSDVALGLPAGQGHGSYGSCPKAVRVEPLTLCIVSEHSPWLIQGLGLCRAPV
jgi:hypothetical protein